MEGHKSSSVVDGAFRERMNSKQTKGDKSSNYRKSPPMTRSELSDFVDSIPIAITMSQEEESTAGDQNMVQEASSNDSEPEKNEDSIWAMVGDSSEERFMSMRENPSLNQTDDQFSSLFSSPIVKTSTVSDENSPRSIPKEVSRASIALSTPLSLLGCSVGGSIVASSYASDTENSPNPASLGKVRIHKFPDELLSKSGASIVSSNGKSEIPANTKEIDVPVETMPGELLSLSGAAIVNSTLIESENSLSLSTENTNGEEKATSQLPGSYKQNSVQAHTPSEIVLTTLPPKLRTLLDTSLSSTSSIEKEDPSETSCPSDEGNSSSRISSESASLGVGTPQRFLQRWKNDEIDVDGDEANRSLLQQSTIGSIEGSRACNETKISVPSLLDSVPGTPPPNLAGNDLGSASPASPMTTLRRNAMHQALEESNIYIRRIEELEDALRLAELKAEEEAGKRKQCEKEVETLQIKVKQNERKSKADSENPITPSSAKSLLERNKTLVKEVRFADQTCVELSEQNLALENQVGQLQSDLKRSRRESESLHEEIVKANWHGAKLEAKLETVQDQLSDERKRLQGEVKSVQSQLAKSQERVRELGDELERVKSEKSRFELQITSSNEKIAALSQECREARQTTAILSECLSEFPDGSKESVATVTDSYRKSQRILQKEKDDLREQCDELSREIQSEREEKKSVMAERNDLQAEAISLKNQFKALKETGAQLIEGKEGLDTSNAFSEGDSDEYSSKGSCENPKTPLTAKLIEFERMIRALELKLMAMHDNRAFQEEPSAETASAVKSLNDKHSISDEREGIREKVFEMTQSTAVSAARAEAKIRDLSIRLGTMSLSMKSLREAVDQKSESVNLGDSLMLSCSLSEAIAGYDKQDSKVDEAECDEVLNATLSHLSQSQETYDEERLLEMMEEARLQEASGNLSSHDDEEVSRMLHIDGLSQLGEDISTIGSIFMDSPFNPHNPSPRQNKREPFEDERRKWEEEKRVLSERLESAQVEYQKLKDSLSCHQDKMKEHNKLKASFDSQSRLVEILEKKVAKLSREKQDLQYSLLKAQKDYDVCRKSLAQLTSKQNITVSDADEDNATAETENQSFGKERKESLKELTSLKKDLKLRQLEYDKMSKHCDDLSNKVETLTASESSCLSRIFMLEEALRKNELEVNKLQMAYASCKEKLTEATEQNASDDSLVSHFESALQAAEMAFRESSGEAAAAKSTAETIRGEKEELMRLVKDLEGKLEAANDTIGEMRMRIAEQSALENEIESLKVSYVTCKDKLATATEENDNYKSLVAELKTALQVAENTCNVIREEEKSKRQELQATIVSIESDLLQAEESAKEKSKRIDILEKERSSLCEKYRHAESSIAEVSSGRNALIKLVDELDVKLKQKETENQEEKNEIAMLKMDLDSAKDELEKSRAYCMDLRDQLETQQNRAIKAAEEVSRLVTLHSTCNDKLAELTRQNENKDAQISDLEAAVEISQNACKRSAGEAATANSLVTTLRDETEKSKAAVEELERELGKAHKLISKKWARIADLQKEHAGLQDKYDTALSFMSVEKKEFRDDISALKGHLQAKQEDLDEALEQCKQQKMLIIELEASARQTASEMDRLKISYVACNDELAKVSDRNAENESLVLQMKTEQEVSKDELAEIEKELFGLRSQLEDVRKQRDELNALVLETDQELEHKNEEWTACKKILEDTLAEKEDVIGNLQTTCREMQCSFEEKLASITKRQKSYTSEIDQERKRANMLEEQLVMAETEVARADEEIATTSQALAEMQEELDSAHEEVHRLTEAHRNARERDAHILREASETKEVANARLKETEVSVSILMKKLEEYSTATSSLEQQLMRAEDEFRRKDEETNQLKSKNASLERKCQRLREYIQKLTTKCEEWAVSYKRQSHVLEKFESQRPRTN